MSSSTSVNTVDRLVRVIESFSAERSTWSLADLSSHLELPKSTLHRFLVSLETHGVLRRDPEDRRWRLGYQLVVWGQLAEEATGLRHLALPVLQEVTDETGEMAVLTIYSNYEVVCIAKTDTHYSVRLALGVGMRRPAHAGASSKILMAYLPKHEIDAIISEKGLPNLCTNTITDREALMQELALIRESGYALSIEETDPHAWGIATPIRDHNDAIVAGLGVAGPTIRYSEEIEQEYVRICRQAALKISGTLGARV